MFTNIHLRVYNITNIWNHIAMWIKVKVLLKKANELLEKVLSQKSYGISGEIFGLISSFLSNWCFWWFWIESVHRSIQLMLDDNTLFSKCDQSSDLLQQLELASGLVIGLYVRKNDLLRCWGWLSVLNWIGALTLTLFLKLSPWNLEPWFVLWSCSLSIKIYYSLLSFLGWCS